MNEQLNDLSRSLNTKNGLVSLVGYKYESPEDCYYRVIGKLTKEHKDATFTKAEFLDMVKGLVSAPKTEDDDKKKFIFNTAKLEEWLEEHKDTWSISNDGKTIVKMQGGAPLEKDVDELATEIAANHLDRDIVVSKDSIATIVKAYLDNTLSTGVEKLVKSIAYDPTKTLYTEGYLAAMHKFFGVKQSFSLFSTCMMHWAWTVKRKMLGLPVMNHLWVSLQGGAGLGKSTLVRRLTNPFGGFAVETTLGKILDSTKEIKLLTSSYILVADELAVNSEVSTDGDHALTRDQLNVLKSILTGDYITARVYGTQAQSRRRITFSVISTSNDRLANVIYDDATMRRYVEFNCLAAPKTNEDFAAFERMTSTLKALNFWCGINENLEGGYLINGTDDYVELRKEQATYFPTNKTTWQWALARANEDYGEELNNKNFLSLGSIEKGASHSMASLYADYTRYCEDWGSKCSSRTKFQEFIIHFIPEYGNFTKNLAEKSAAFDTWFDTLRGLTEEQAQHKVMGFPTVEDIRSTPF